MKGCDWTNLIRLALKSAALALIATKIWVTLAQLQDCNLIGLQEDPSSACYRPGPTLIFIVGLYVNIYILLAVGFVCSANSLVVVGFGFEYGKSLFVIASVPFWNDNFPWFMGY